MTQRVGTYRFNVYQRGSDPVADGLTIQVHATTHIEASNKAREQAGLGRATITTLLEQVVDGQAKERDFRVFVEGIGNASEGPTYRAHSAEAALEMARAEHGEAAQWIRYSTLVTDAQRVQEVAAQGSGDTAEEIAQKLGLMQPEYVDGSRLYAGSDAPEHILFADGSVSDLDLENYYENVDDYLGELGAAAHEVASANFHAGDSGYPRSMDEQYRDAHDQRQQLRRPALSDTLAAQAVAGNDAARQR